MDTYNILTDLFSSVSMVVMALVVYVFIPKKELWYHTKCTNVSVTQIIIKNSSSFNVFMSHKCMLQHVTEENSVQKV